MRKLVIGMALASTAVASPALARDGAWYVELDGGPMIVQDLDLDITGITQTAADYDSETGYDFGGVVGYDLGAFRLEAEGSYRSADVKQIIGTTGLALPGSSPVQTSFAPAGAYRARGDASVLSFMVNALADFGDDDGLQGFVGGGIGVARTKFSDVTINSSGPGFLDDSDSGLAYQILAGVRAPLTDTIDVGLKYRFFNTTDLDLVDNIGRDVETEWKSHSLLGTIGFNFGGAAPLPDITCWDGTTVPAGGICPDRPAPVLTPPPPPVVQAPICNKGPFIVFFEWDKSDITDGAATILNSAVSAYANCGSAAVMLAGHADRSGSNAYNVGLSQRRADAVRSYMTARGIPDTRISTEAFGETVNRVPTADGVRELQNRRVEISYGPGSGM